MSLSNKTPANQRPGTQKGKAGAAPKKDLGSATGYAPFSKTKAGLTGSKK